MSRGVHLVMAAVANSSSSSSTSCVGGGSGGRGGRGVRVGVGVAHWSVVLPVLPCWSVRGSSSNNTWCIRSEESVCVCGKSVCVLYFRVVILLYHCVWCT